MKIYTKTGDSGKTSLVGGRRVKKTDSLIEAYGTLDELNACIGLVIAEMPDPFLTDIQRLLFVIGGMLATEPDKWEQYWPDANLEASLLQIEAEIDRLNADLKPFQGFILPQGSATIAHIHICRTVCRRAERNIAVLLEENSQYGLLLKLANRMSDYFFILALFCHKKDNIDITYWK